MTKNLYLDYDAFLRSIKQNCDVPHSFLLGAGASISSGIQSAYDCIWEWKKDIYISKNINADKFYHNYKNDSVRASIQIWLDTQGNYPSLDSNEEYSFYAEQAYPIAEDRRKYFQNLFEDTKPYVGYQLLTLLAENQFLKAVWTTNFDGLFIRAVYQTHMTPIEITLDNSDRIYRNQSTKEILSIALHGDYKYSSLKNTNTELDSQLDSFQEKIKDYHLDKNLIVMGYSGRDKSLMTSLKKAFSTKGSGRLYWCGYGANISVEVEELLLLARDSGREAFYITTEGFDKTLIHLTKTIFEQNSEVSNKIQKILELDKNEKLNISKFIIPNNSTDKYIKSNLHPITFPKEVFSFEIDFIDLKPWKFIKKITSNTNICAVPFKGKIYALGTLSEITTIFSKYLKSEILRHSISIYDIKKNSALNSLILTTIIKYISLNYNLDSNFKNKIWQKESFNNQYNTMIHKAIYLSLHFDEKEKFGYLSFVPTIHITSQSLITKELKQKLSKIHLEKLYNLQYHDELEKWNNILFMDNKLKFEFPNASGTGFNFAISKNTAYAEIHVINKRTNLPKPKNYDNNLTLFKGMQFIEPNLIFKNIDTNTLFKDFHPMRGLVNNNPIDINLNGLIFSNNINISIICEPKHAQKLYSFLKEIHNSFINSNQNSDYLIDFPGFYKIFNIEINIPSPHAESWLDIDFVYDKNQEISKNSITLAQQICKKIDQIYNTSNKSTIVIFIPNDWHLFESFEGENISFDLHDYIKAYAASKGVSTQLIREDTLFDQLKCQIYWWLSLSFYVKSLRTPWLLDSVDNRTAYAGIGYSINHKNENKEIVIGCSHIYDAHGQGLKYKLSKIDNFYLDKQKNPFLSYKDAFQLGISIQELFYQSFSTLPERVVIHKRTKFTNDEINGITSSLKKAGINKIDLIEINFEFDVKFLSMTVNNSILQPEKFPISRGTCIVTTENTALLWTHGVVASVRNPNFKFYLGGKSIPTPLKITKHYGQSNIDAIATEILGLTKMNWNSLNLYTKLPATIESSNHIARIGKLLSKFESKTYDYRLFI